MLLRALWNRSALPIAILLICPLDPAQALAATAGPLEVAIARIADTSTSIPDGSGTFTGFEQAVVDSGNLAFVGAGAEGQRGIYLYRDGSLSRVVDANTAIPGQPGSTFSELAPAPRGKSLSILGGEVAFRASNSESGIGGIYHTISGQLTRCVDEALFPEFLFTGGIGGFAPFHHLTLHGDGVVFMAPGVRLLANGTRARDVPPGIFTCSDSVLSAEVLDGQSLGFELGTVDVLEWLDSSGDTIVFRARTSRFPEFPRSIAGLFQLDRRSGEISKILDDAHPIPGFPPEFPDGPFTGPGVQSTLLSTDSTTTAFGGALLINGGFDENGVPIMTLGSVGVFDNRFGPFRYLADAPPSPFLSVSNGVLALSNRESIQTNLRDAFETVIDTSTRLDGRTIQEFVLDSDGFSGREIAFIAFFEDQTSGVYVATLTVPVPESPAAAQLLAALAAMFALQRIRRSAACERAVC